MVYPRKYHVYTMYIIEIYIYMVYTKAYTRHIPERGVPDAAAWKGLSVHQPTSTQFRFELITESIDSRGNG
jgi:hypothetical protein